MGRSLAGRSGLQMPSRTANHGIALQTSCSFSSRTFAGAGTGTLYIVLVMLLLSSCSRTTSYSEAPRAGQEIVVDVAGFSQEIPRYFTYSYKGKNINYFIVRSGDKVLGFLDACASCFPQKKGYSFDRGYFICRACNVRYSVSEIEKGIGGCFPIRISGELRGQKFVIPASTLEAAVDKF